MKLKILKEDYLEDDELEPLNDDLIKDWADDDYKKGIKLTFDQFIKEAANNDRLATKEDYELYCNFFKYLINWEINDEAHPLYMIYSTVCDELDVLPSIERLPAGEFACYRTPGAIASLLYIIPFDEECKFMDELGKEFITNKTKSKDYYYNKIGNFITDHENLSDDEVDGEDDF